MGRQISSMKLRDDGVGDRPSQALKLFQANQSLLIEWIIINKAKLHDLSTADGLNVNDS